MKVNLQPLIFIVDDDIFYLKLIEQNLKSASYTRLLTFTSGEECVNNLHLIPDIILLDYNLNTINGIEVLHQIKLYSPEAYVFFLSAQEEIEVAISTIKQGAFGYIVKDQFAFINILEEIKAVTDFQPENKPGTASRMVGLRDYIALREQHDSILTYKNEQLAKVNAELDKFVYSASHDLRGPLTSMLGLIKVAQIEADNLNRQHFLELMEKTVHKLDTTVKEIINYSTNNRIEIKSQSIDIEATIHKIFEHVQDVNGASRITKNVMIKQSGIFLSDACRLQIILKNLITNSIKYQDFTKEQPVIQLSVEIDDYKASICISDNGCGIEEGYLTKIFDMFSRGTDRSNGSGLGLYIVKEVINKLKGTIEVSSRCGQGTSFYIELPNHLRYNPNKI